MCGIFCILNPSQSIDQIGKSFDQIKSRGPEVSNLTKVGHHYIGFHRLAIQGLSEDGNQPFVRKFGDKTIYSICNGEIYNYNQLSNEFQSLLVSQSDCEILPHLYHKYRNQMVEHLDGEFAFIILDVEGSNVTVHIGRDPFGVRPLFYGIGEKGMMVFGSELKSIHLLCQQVKVFPPGHTMTIYNTGIYTEKYYHLPLCSLSDSMENIYEMIREYFTLSIRKRLVSERPIGCLLSGGLDSSIVSAVSSKLVNQPLHTFTIGLEGATDIKYAELVAQHINSKHTTFIVTVEEALESIDQVIYTIESYDCTTVRASVWQYLLGKKIKQNTDIKVLLTGEGSDELMSGYLYFHNAPDPESSHQENIRLLTDIHRFDGLRVDRAMSCHGLEVRIPFLDKLFVEMYLSLPKDLRTASKTRIEKGLFRDSFSKTNLLPEKDLYRKKEAFSDGTSCNEKSWYQHIQEYIQNLISDQEFQTHTYGNQVDTKEKYYYRKKFEQFFGTKSTDVIPYYWLPKWCGEISEPSARVLSVYS
jgi:asparagine synthase (glutamine-hydrolysing)